MSIDDAAVELLKGGLPSGDSVADNLGAPDEWPEGFAGSVQELTMRVEVLPVAAVGVTARVEGPCKVRTAGDLWGTRIVRVLRPGETGTFAVGSDGQWEWLHTALPPLGPPPQVSVKQVVKVEREESLEERVKRKTKEQWG